MHRLSLTVLRKRHKMKIAVFSTLALFAICGLALADYGADYYSQGSYGSWGGYGGASYVPVALPAGGAKGGSSFLGALLPLLFLLILLPQLFGRSESRDNVILLNSTLRSVGK